MTPEAPRLVPGIDVSRETRERLGLYAQVLEKWNPAINLVAKSTLADLWSRHFVDSAQLFDLADNDPTSWADLGSGGGFPGAVIAILAAEKRPALRVICVESDKRKATFLRTVARETGVDFAVIADRIEHVPPLAADVVSARALASLPDLIGYAYRHLAPHGIALFPKGTGYTAEADLALASWSFRLDTFPSRTDPGSTILKLGDIRRV